MNKTMSYFYVYELLLVFSFEIGRALEFGFLFLEIFESEIARKNRPHSRDIIKQYSIFLHNSYEEHRLPVSSNFVNS
jgi:hypothetical protein